MFRARHLKSFCKSLLGFKRTLSIYPPVLQRRPDPIEQLYNEKVQEYRAKSRDDKMVEPTPEILEEMRSELLRVARKYGSENGADLEQFPEFKFDEPEIDPIMEEVSKTDKN